MLHQMLLSRLIAAASALIFSVLSFVAPPQRVADEGTVVRVGLCFGETAKRSITVRASGGFTLGRAEEDGWTALLTTECETIVVSRRLARPVTGESRYKNASAAAEAAAQSGGTVLYENGAYAVAEGLSPADAEPLFVVADALRCARESGYGIVMPSVEELNLEDPEIVRQGGRYGVRMKASAPSIHMIRADIETVVSPIVGNEKQSEDMVNYLMQEFEGDTSKIWNSNIFGRSFHEIVEEDLQAKLKRMPESAQKKLREALGRIINEGSGGLICIIL